MIYNYANNIFYKYSINSNNLPEPHYLNASVTFSGNPDDSVKPASILARLKTKSGVVNIFYNTDTYIFLTPENNYSGTFEIRDAEYSRENYTIEFVQSTINSSYTSYMKNITFGTLSNTDDGITCVATLPANKVPVTLKLELKDANENKISYFEDSIELIFYTVAGTSQTTIFTFSIDKIMSGEYTIGYVNQGYVTPLLLKISPNLPYAAFSSTSESFTTDKTIEATFTKYNLHPVNGAASGKFMLNYKPISPVYVDVRPFQKFYVDNIIKTVEATLYASTSSVASYEFEIDGLDDTKEYMFDIRTEGYCRVTGYIRDGVWSYQKAVTASSLTIVPTYNQNFPDKKYYIYPVSKNLILSNTYNPDVGGSTTTAKTFMGYVNTISRKSNGELVFSPMSTSFVGSTQSKTFTFDTSLCLVSGFTRDKTTHVTNDYYVYSSTITWYTGKIVTELRKYS